MVWVTAHNTETLPDVNRARNSPLGLTQGHKRPWVSWTWTQAWRLPQAFPVLPGLCALSSLPTSGPRGIWAPSCLWEGGVGHCHTFLPPSAPVYINMSRPQTIPHSPLYASSHSSSCLTLTQTHLSYVETEAQRGEVICPNSILRAKAWLQVFPTSKFRLKTESSVKSIQYTGNTSSVPAPDTENWTQTGSALKSWGWWGRGRM